MDKFLDFLLWGLVAFTVVLFVSLIIIGDATYFRFLSTETETHFLTAQIGTLGSKLL